MALEKDKILEVLRGVKDPVSGGDIVSANRVRAVKIDAGQVRFVLEVPADSADDFQSVKAEAESKLKALPEVAGVMVAMTAHSTPKPPPDLKAAGGARPSPPPRQPIPGVSNIVAIASGKGGVGKSTVSANLAAAMAAKGLSVGLLDADVYGPSQPRMMGVNQRPSSPDGKRINPLTAHGVTMMSIGLMLEEGQAIVWRGPMLMGALQQMLMQVEWGRLDVLLVDLPPGTGDVQLTLCQKTYVSGAVVVSTPQDIALIDARKAIGMFDQLNVPILGMVENMSTHICSNCGHEEHVFGHGGAAAEAASIGAPLLAEVPLHIDIRTHADGGTPIVVAKPESAQAQAFKTAADGLWSQLATVN